MAGTKKVAGNLVDSGTFGVYVNGKRVASEKFEIVQSPEMSVAKAELKLDESKNAQMAELQMKPNGDLIRYQWSEKDQGTAVVEPKDEFLVEHVTIVQPAKSAEQPFILPPSTQILDDYFFSQRQLLLWRYLSSQCRIAPGQKGCELKPTQFGVIVPRQQSSAQVTVEYAGQQKLSVRGSDQEMSRFTFKTEGGDWNIWMDSAYKIQKIAIVGDNTEVVRD
jgi:hypothetical protein